MFRAHARTQFSLTYNTPCQSMNTSKIIALFILSSMLGLAQDVIFNESKIEATFGKEFLEKILDAQYSLQEKANQEEETDDEEEADDEEGAETENASKKQEKTDALIKETLMYVNLKKLTDEKIAEGRDEIKNLRQRLASLEKVVLAERHKKWTKSAQSRRETRHSTAEKYTTLLADYKIAVQQLVSFSNALKDVVDQNMRTLKNMDEEAVKAHPVLSKMKNRSVAQGCEKERGRLDNYHAY